MEKNPYYEDWLRKIETMSEEELMNVVSNGNYDSDFLKLAEERLSYLKDGEPSNGTWHTRIKDAGVKVEKHETMVTPTNYVDNGAENTLLFIANVTLIIGIIASIIFIFAGFASGQIVGIAAAIAVFVPCLVTWATLKVFANISKTLKEIRDRMPKA